MDYENYTYVPLGAPNILSEHVKHLLPPTGVTTTHKVLEGTLLQLSLRHPGWKFVGTRIQNNVATTFEVYEGGEYLGSVFLDYRGYKSAIGVTNNKIEREVQRGNSLRTSDPKRAIKIVEKFFAPRTIGEIAANTVRLARDVISTSLGQKRRDLTNLLGAGIDRPSIATTLLSYAINNIEQFKPIMVEAGHKEGIIDELPNALDAVGAVVGINNANTAGKGYVIAIRGNDYIAMHPTPQNLAHTVDLPKYRLETSESLRPDVRRNLGMLKLLSVGQCICSVGVRLSDTQFYVMCEEDGDE
jgi:hypothetical protein